MNRLCLAGCAVILTLVSFLFACSPGQTDLSGIGATLVVKVTGNDHSRAGKGTLFLFTDIYPSVSEVDYNNWLMKANLNGDSIVRFKLDFTMDHLKYDATSFVILYKLSEEQLLWGRAVCLGVGEYKEIELDVSDKKE